MDVQAGQDIYAAFALIRIHTGWMKASRKMIIAAQRAEYDYYQRGRTDAGRFIPTPDAIIKVMLDAALELVDVAEKATQVKTSIVTAQKPSRRR